MTLNFLNQDNYQIYNRELAHHLGSIKASIFISDLINRLDYHRKENKLIKKDGKLWFYYTHDKCFERTAMTREEQDVAIKVLIKHKLIIKKIIGVPAKRHFYIDEDKILEIFGYSKKHSSLRVSHKLGCGNPTDSVVDIPQTPHIDKNPSKNPSKEEEKKPVSVSKSSKKEEEKKAFGADGIVLLTQEQVDGLAKTIAPDILQKLIQDLNDYVASTGKKYKSHFHTLKQWYRKGVEEGKIVPVVMTPSTAIGREIQKIRDIKSEKKLTYDQLTMRIDRTEVKIGDKWTAVAFNDPDYLVKVMKALRDGGYL